MKAGLEIKAGIKNLLSSVFSQITSINNMGPKTVYSLTEGMNDNGGRTAGIISSVVFDKDAGSRFFNWEVAKGAVSLAALTPAGKAGNLNGPMLAAEVSPTVANEGVKIAEQAAKGGQTIIGEGMKRVSMEAAKRSRSVILNNMPKFTGTADQVTSQMMTYNRQWILQQMRSGRPVWILDLMQREQLQVFFIKWSKV